jgi:hypothetical protein
MRTALIAIFLLLASCSMASKRHLMDSGYSIDAGRGDEFAFELHLNQLKQLGGDVHGPQFRLFVAERLKWHELCPQGWAPLPCVEDGSCIQRTNRSVTVQGRCTP